MYKFTLTLFLYLLNNSPSFHSAGLNIFRCNDDSVVMAIKRIDSLITRELQRSLCSDSLDGLNDSLLMAIQQRARRLPTMLRDRDTLIRYYVDDLEDYVEVIDSILRTDDRDVKQALIRFMHDDIAAKFWFPGIGAEPNNPLTTVKVKLKVMDKSGEQELKGYVGYLKPQLSNLLKNVTVFIPTFGNEKNVSPGIKLVWIEKEGKMIQSRIETLHRTMGTLEIAFLIIEQ